MLKTPKKVNGLRGSKDEEIPSVVSSYLPSGAKEDNPNFVTLTKQQEFEDS